MSEALHTKELNPQEQEVVRDLEAKLVEYESQLTVLNKQASELRREESLIKEQLAQITSPFAVGDIVIDEAGVRYRVTRVTSTRPLGIRLNANGAEAHKDSRTIWSNQLSPVSS